MPARLVDVGVPMGVRASLAAHSSTDLQSILDRVARPGDEIVLDAGITYAQITLPYFDGAGWVTIRGNGLPAGRVTGDKFAAMPKILGSDDRPAVTTAAAAHHYRFQGVELLPIARRYVYNLVRFGTGLESRIDLLPHHMILDRCYVHGDPIMGGKNGILLNGSDMAVIDCVVSDWKSPDQDTQAILGYNGPGPFKIQNCYLEAAGENVLFGGATPMLGSVIPSDIEFRQNLVSKPLAWRATRWSVKNLLELKNAQRVLCEGNTFENVWLGAQVGFAIVLTVRDEDGAVPWAVVQDVTFRNNVVRHAACGINVLGRDAHQSETRTRRIDINNNLFDDINGAAYGGTGHWLQFVNGPSDINVERNTVRHTGNIMMADGAPPCERVTFRGNIMPNNEYGFIGSGTGVGLDTMRKFFPGIIFEGNMVVGGAPASYPLNNLMVTSIPAITMVGYGVDLVALQAAQSASAPVVPVPVPVVVPPTLAGTKYQITKDGKVVGDLTMYP